MTKITPPRPKGQRIKPSQQVTMYRATVNKLDILVKRKNTTRVEYLRWAMDCAEAGLIGPTPGNDFLHEIDDFVTGMLDGQMTHLEGVNFIAGLVRRACLDTRFFTESEWSGANDKD